ncbi:MAG: hypothetical protein P8R37_06150 [Opitutae bacterium]|nr:hypothetical protein [Opitutae bacterium]
MMVIYLSRWEHTYTVKSPIRKKLFRCLSYDEVFAAKSLPCATYIFTDFDRLSQWELELASCVYQNLRNGGAQVLNHPAQVACRYELLRRLHLAGVNSFNVYRPSLDEWPTRYPVFVRRDSFHDGMLSGLLETREALDAALKLVESYGVPFSNTIVIEFAAEPVEGDLYRKQACYRVGDQFFVDTTVHERNWIVKYGELGVAPETRYAAELAEINSVPYAPTVKRVFDIAKIEYGRVDIGLYQGKPQFYEINTNPTVSFNTKHPSPSRALSREQFVVNYTEAIRALNQSFTSAAGKIEMTGKFLSRQRRKARWRSWSRPTL